MRSTDFIALGCDLKIIQMILKSDNKSAKIRNSNNNNSSSSSSSSSSSNGAQKSQEIEQDEIVLSNLSSKCIVEQLPNTLSISLKGLIDLFFLYNQRAYLNHYMEL